MKLTTNANKVSNMRKLNSNFYLIVLVLIANSSFSILKGQDTLNVSQIEVSSVNQLQKQLPVTLNKIPQQFNFQDRTLLNKFWRGMGYSVIYNVNMGLLLMALPDDITQWHAVDKFKIPVIRNQYKKSFTSSPVIDNDLWVVDYIGHPYQGSFYFNSIRSQGGTFLQSSLYNVFQSTVWEYIWEGGLEQPSIQDLIVTPIVGSLLGELTHQATLSMRKNGFKWYEIVAVCLINPTYAINNGFKDK